LHLRRKGRCGRLEQALTRLVHQATYPKGTSLADFGRAHIRVALEGRAGVLALARPRKAQPLPLAGGFHAFTYSGAGLTQPALVPAKGIAAQLLVIHARDFDVDQELCGL